MKYKINDLITCKVEIRSSGAKAISFSDDENLEKRKFQIIAIASHISNSYYILIDDDMIGWIISNFHIKHYNVDSKFFGKKFYEIGEDFIYE